MSFFKKYSGVLALLAATLCWGPAPVVTKLALEEIPQMQFAFITRGIAFVLLFLIFFRKGYFKISKKHLPLLITAGLSGSFLNFSLFLGGIKLTNAMDAQAIFTVSPVITAIFAHYFLRERIKSVQIIGVIIGFLGAVLIATKDYWETGSLVVGNMFGNFLIFLAAVSWVGYILVSKKLSKTYSPITITIYSFMIGFITFIPFAFYEAMGNTSWINSLSNSALIGLVYQGIFSSVLAFLFYQIGLKLTSAFAAGVILYLNPVLTSVFSIPILGERLSLTFLIGAALIIAGSFTATQYETVRKRVSFGFFKPKA